MPVSLARPVVLLVEDSEDDAFFFRRALKQSGIACSVFHVLDGVSTMDYFKAACARPNDASRPWPDLVFLDLKLPTFSGFEILSWLRNHQLPADMDVNVLSGSDQSPDIQRAMQLGATTFAVKPVTAEQLRERFQCWQTRRDEHAQLAAAVPPARIGRSA